MGLVALEDAGYLLLEVGVGLLQEAVAKAEWVVQLVESIPVSRTVIKTTTNIIRPQTNTTVQRINPAPQPIPEPPCLPQLLPTKLC